MFSVVNRKVTHATKFTHGHEFTTHDSRRTLMTTMSNAPLFLGHTVHFCFQPVNTDSAVTSKVKSSYRNAKFFNKSENIDELINKI